MDKKTAAIWLTVFVASLLLDSVGHIVIAGEFISKELEGVINICGLKPAVFLQECRNIILMV